MSRSMKSLAPCFVLAVCGATLTGCSQMHESPDYERHTNSRISQPLDGGDYYWFDVKVTPAMPLESEAAETKRQIWLQTWLLQRRLCPAGYEVIERRPFEFLEHNPARMDIRYKVRCVVEMPEETVG